MRTIKEKLSAYPYAVQEAERLRAEQQAIIRLARRIRNFDDPSGKEKLARLKMQLDAYVKQSQKETADVRRQIRSLPDPRARELCTLRYIQGLSWDEIAEKLYLDVDSKAVYKLHAKALSALQKRTK